MPRLTGHALGGEVRDRTKLAVLVDAEILLVQAGDEAAAPVADRGRDVDQLDAGSEAKGFLIRSLALLGTLLRGDRGDGREGGENGDACQCGHGVLRGTWLCSAAVLSARRST